MLDMTSDNPHECEDPFHKETPPLAEVIDFPQPNTAPQQTAPAPAPQAQPVVGNPVCPHCGEEQGIHGKMTRLGPFQVMVVCCRNQNCRKILGAFQALEMQMIPMGGGKPN
jgi:hypothetical protein